MIPGFAGIYGFFSSEDPKCDPDPSVVCLVSGINLLVIFLFCVYCCFALGKKYGEGTTTRYAGGKTVSEKNMAERICNLICYDPGFCCGIFYLVFAAGWMFYGFSVTGSIKSDDPCRDSDKNALQIKITTI